MTYENRSKLTLRHCKDVLRGLKPSMACQLDVGSIFVEAIRNDEEGLVDIIRIFNGDGQVDHEVNLIRVPNKLPTAKGYWLYFICSVSGHKCKCLYFNGKDKFVSRLAIKDIYNNQRESKLMRRGYAALSYLEYTDGWHEFCNKKGLKKHRKYVREGVPTKRYEEFLKYYNVKEHYMRMCAERLF